MAVQVNIYINDDTVQSNPVAGVVVNIYDGATFVTTVTSDAAGLAGLLLPGAAAPGKSYEVRFYKLGAIFSGPKLIQVVEPVGVEPNYFDESCTVVVLPVSGDPSTCRCTGKVVDFANRPLANIMVRVSAIGEAGFQVPKLVNNNLVQPESVELKTDVNGKISFDLIRGGEYYITWAGEDDEVWNFNVPDRTSVNLWDLVFPQPVSLDWDDVVAPGDAISVAVGETKTVPISILFSDFVKRTEGLEKWISLTNSNESKMSVELVGVGEVAITGIAVGAAQVSAELNDGLQPARSPGYSLAVPTLNVTIT